MHRILQNVFWISPAILEFAIAVTMVRRRLSTKYPFFWAYLVFDILRTALLFAIGNDPAHYRGYFFAFWQTEVFSCLLGFLIVIEIFREAFAKRLGLQERGTTLLQFSLVVLVIMALWIAVETPKSDSNNLVAGIVVLKRAESLVRAGLVAGLFIFVLALGLPWDSQTIGIAAGCCIQGTAETLVWAARTHYGRSANRLLVWSLLIATFCQTLLWAAYFLRRRPEPAISWPDAGAHSKVSAKIEHIGEAVGVLLER
jgi:hypothetical protein